MNEPCTSKPNYGLLILLILISFFLRFYDLGRNPLGFFRDEADKGYTSYSLLRTGCDQTGRAWPLFVRSLNVTTSALYQYLDIPFIALFGLNETAVRLPACLAGTLSVLAVFILVNQWWGSRMAFWAGLFVGFSPWSMLLSRWANQSILLTASIPLGVYFFTRMVKNQFKSYGNSVGSAVFFVIALYAYEPAQLFVPVFVTLLWLAAISKEVLFQQRKLFLRSLLLFFLILIIGGLPLLHHLFFETTESTARFSRISIFDGRPFFAIFLEWYHNYWLHLSPRFLFWTGDANPRHHIVWGQENPLLAPLFLLGLIQTIRKRTFLDRLLLVWFFCFPIAAACTRESIPHALRSIFAVPIIPILAAYGIPLWQEWKPKIDATLPSNETQVYSFLWLTSWGISIVFYIGYFLYFYPQQSVMSWEYGYREALAWRREHRSEYPKTVVTGYAEYPYIFFLFYDRYPPELWQKEHQIEGVFFIPVGQPIDAYYKGSQERILYLLRPNELPHNLPQKVIIFPFPSGSVWKWVAAG